MKNIGSCCIVEIKAESYLDEEQMENFLEFNSTPIAHNLGKQGTIIITIIATSVYITFLFPQGTQITIHMHKLFLWCTS